MLILKIAAKYKYIEGLTERQAANESSNGLLAPLWRPHGSRGLCGSAHHGRVPMAEHWVVT